MSGNALGCYNWRLAATRILWGRLGVLLNILWCMGQAPTAKDYPAQNVSSAKVEKHCADAFINASFSEHNNYNTTYIFWGSIKSCHNIKKWSQ